MNPRKQKDGSGSVLRKSMMGLVGAAYMCLALMTLTLLSAVMGVGLVRFWVEEPVHLKERLYFDYRDAHPKAVLDFGVEEYDKLVKTVPVGHSCNVRLLFVMPESDYNRDTGMFQVVAESLALNGDVITSSSRPCMLRFRSQPVRLMQTFFMAVPLLLGITSEIQTVNVPLLKYKERYYHRTQFIRISLVPRAGTPFLPQIYEANLIVSSELPWMKRVVRNWKWTFSVWTSLYIYLMLLLVLICFFRSMLFPAAQTNVSDYQRVAGSDDMGEGPPQVVVSAGGRRTSDILKQWRQSRGKRKAMVYGEGSDATSMSVTRDDDTGVTTPEEVGDSESVCQ
ncbi:putative Seipin family protein [Helianthus anomalus]